MSFGQYSSYQDSGVEWLGAVPESWKLLPAKRSFSRKKDLNSGMKCENRLSLTLGGVFPRDLNDLDGLQASEFETYQIFQANDLVFKLIDLQNIRTSRVGLVPETGIMSPAYIRLEPNRECVIPKFAYWYFTDLYNRCIFNELGGGVRQTLTSEELLLLPFPSPSLPEQTRIAAFLDRETAKIDGLVAEQQRLIDLLKEKRQAVISHAVTKGLNPAAPMKPSGIEWLGDLPAHWAVVPLSKMADWDGGLFLDGDWIESADISEEGIRYLTSGNVGEGEYKEQGQGFISQEKFDELNCTDVVPGDILISRLNLPAGRACLVPDLGGRIVTCVDNVIFRPKPEHDRRFLVFLFSSKRHFANTEILARGATMQRISRSTLGGIRFALPPYEEQIAIARWIDVEIGSIDALTAESQRAIDLLQERRTALISAAVTGQIDVRHLAEAGAA